MPPNSSPSDAGGFAPRHHRTVLFYGEAGFARIRAARVTVIGLGGVGAHAAVNLARSGIGALHLVDFDTVTESSLNRSPCAGPEDVGSTKAEVLADHLAKVSPETVVRTSEVFCNDDTLPELVPPTGGDRPALVLDAIDALNPKVNLLAWCADHGIPVITSMGAAGKRDAGAVRTGDLADTEVCPLAKHVRRRLRRRGVTGGIPCVWSLERGDADRPDAPKESDGPAGAVAGDGGRVRHTLASQMTVPGVFGYALAALALDHFAGRSEP